jgi:hypothetical protein
MRNGLCVMSAIELKNYDMGGYGGRTVGPVTEALWVFLLQCLERSKLFGSAKRSIQP